MIKVNKNIDPRIPKEAGEGSLASYPAVCSPWNKLINAEETLKYVTRISAIQASLMFEVMRILVPDYDERCTILCEASYADGWAPYATPQGAMSLPFYNTPPFLKGGCMFGLAGDYGDELHTMAGRVNEFSTYRVEKELDNCPIDIVGSELGRATTTMLQAIGDGMNSAQLGPHVDLQMIEAKCCGDLHCRLIGENREKYPLPDHSYMDCYGPVVAKDQIRCTPEENCAPQAQYLSPETDYKYTNALVMQFGVSESLAQPHLKVLRDIGVAFGQRFFRVCTETGRLTKEEVDNCLRWVFEGAGKAMFTDMFAIKGLRDWMGVPADVNDGRLLGGYIEMILQTIQCPYEIEAFSKDVVIYRIDRKLLVWENSYLTDAWVAQWHGMAKTLISAMYAVWEEQGDAPEEMLRIKIARKVDKYGS